MTGRPPRVGLLGYFGSGNLGNDASLDAVLGWLTEWLPRSALTCVTRETGVTGQRWELPTLALTAAGRGGDRRLIAAMRRVLDPLLAARACRELDAVVVPGMGVLEEQLGVRPWGLPLSLLIWAIACRLTGTPFVLLAVGGERAANPMTRWMFAAVIRLSSRTSFRDHYSAQALTRAAMSARTVVPDLVFRLPSAVDAGPDAGDGRAIVGVMAYFGPGDDRATGRATHEAYIEQMVALVAQLDRRGHRVELVVGDDGDVAAAESVRQRAPVEVTVVAARSQQQLEATIAGADFVVACRYHTLVAAVRCGLPVVSIGYGAKNAALLAELGLADRARHIEDWDVGWALTATTAAVVDRAATRRRSDAYRRKACRALDIHLAELRRRLERTDGRSVCCQPMARKTG